MPYRYNLTPARSGKCNVFLPNALRDGEVPKHLHSCKVPCVASWPEWPNRLFLRHATVGAVWVSHMDKLPRSNMAAVVWEAMLSEAVCVFFPSKVEAIQLLLGTGPTANRRWKSKGDRTQAKDFSARISHCAIKGMVQAVVDVFGLLAVRIS